MEFRDFTEVLQGRRIAAAAATLALVMPAELAINTDTALAHVKPGITTMQTTPMNGPSTNTEVPTKTIPQPPTETQPTATETVTDTVTQTSTSGENDQQVKNDDGLAIGMVLGAAILILGLGSGAGRRR